MFAFAKLVVLSVALVGAVNGATHSARHRRHAGTNYLGRSDSDNETHVFEKRFDNARMTFYEAGMGACGKTNNDGDYVSLSLSLRVSRVVERPFAQPSLMFVT